MMIRKKPVDKQGSLKTDIKMQQGEKYIKIVSIYVPLFRTGSPEALLKLIIMFNKIINGEDF